MSAVGVTVNDYSGRGILVFPEDRFIGFVAADERDREGDHSYCSQYSLREPFHFVCH